MNEEILFQENYIEKENKNGSMKLSIQSKVCIISLCVLCIYFLIFIPLILIHSISSKRK